MAEFCCTTLTLSLPKAAKVRKNQILISFGLMLKNKYSYCSTMWSTNSKVENHLSGINSSCTAGILFSWGKHCAWVTALLNSKNIEELWGITVGGDARKKYFCHPSLVSFFHHYAYPGGWYFYSLSPVLLSDIQGWQSWHSNHKQAAFACPRNKPADGTHLCTMCLVYLVGCGIYSISSFL